MKILVFNGSPKGQYSITLQTIHFLQRKYPQHTFTVLDVGRKIRSYEKDFTEVIEKIRENELLLFSYPVYTFIAPYQLHRFIELLKEQVDDLSDKFASQITTSKHFYDITAHRYIKDNCMDLGMKYTNGLSADMDDLLTEKGQKEACDFLEYIVYCAEHDRYEPLPQSNGAAAHCPVTVPNASAKNQKGKVIIVTNREKSDTKLTAMIDRFTAVLPIKTEIVELLDYPFSG